MHRIYYLSFAAKLLLFSRNELKVIWLPLKVLHPMIKSDLIIYTHTNHVYNIG